MWLYSIIFGLLMIFSSQMMTATLTLNNLSDYFIAHQLDTGFRLSKSSTEYLREDKTSCLSTIQSIPSVIPSSCLDTGIIDYGYTFGANVLYNEKFNTRGFVSVISSNGKVISIFSSTHSVLMKVAGLARDEGATLIFGFKYGNGLKDEVNNEVKVDEATRQAFNVVRNLIDDGSLVYIY